MLRLFRSCALRLLARAVPAAGLGALLAALVPALLGAAPAVAGELVMFERKGCVYCAKFDRDVAPLYGRTDEGHVAPLRRVDLGDGVPGDIALSAPVRFAPTFVVLDEGREIGRITGYASDEAFWGLLGALTARIAPGSREAAAAVHR